MFKTAFAIILSALLLVAGASSASASSIVFGVTVDTSALAVLPGSAAGPFYLDFQLNDGGGGLGTALNSATISNFGFGGGAAAGSASLFGNAGGDLTSSVSLNDNGSAFNEFFQSFTPGSVLSFFVTLTTNVEAPTPDAFAFAILDGNLLNLLTNGPGDTLLLVNIDNPIVGGNLQTFQSVDARLGGVVSVAAEPVPEPATLLLLGAGLIGSAAVRRRAVRGSNRAGRSSRLP